MRPGRPRSIWRLVPVPAGATVKEARGTPSEVSCRPAQVGREPPNIRRQRCTGRPADALEDGPMRADQNPIDYQILIERDTKIPVSGGGRENYSLRGGAPFVGSLLVVLGRSQPTWQWQPMPTCTPIVGVIAELPMSICQATASSQQTQWGRTRQPSSPSLRTRAAIRV